MLMLMLTVANNEPNKWRSLSVFEEFSCFKLGKIIWDIKIRVY